MALLKLQPADPAPDAPCRVSAGLRRAVPTPEVALKDKVMISNTGDRTACFFLVDDSKKDFSLVRGSAVLPPYFMLPPMMEFGVDPQALFAEWQQHKVRARRGAEA